MKGFKTSNDYSNLWELINNGIRVPCWVEKQYNSGRKYNVIAEVKLSLNNKYSIGSPGIGYDGWENTKNGFIENCKEINLIYIQPNKQ